MDDAGDGRRGLRATPTQELWRLLQSRYGIAAEDGVADLGGSSNLNLLVGGGRWVARVYRPYVSPARLEAIGLVRRALAAGGVPVAGVRTTLDGVPWARLGDRLVEVEPYVPSDARMNSWGLLEAGLPLLGRVHSVLAHVDAGSADQRPMFGNHVEADEALAWAQRAAARIRAWRPTPSEEQLAESAVDLARQLWPLEREFAAVSPRQLVHGDFWDNNLLFQGGRVALLTDFDFMGERPRIDDLALTLHFASLEHPNDMGSDECFRRLRVLVDAYDSGLDVRLSDAERAALPLALARQPLWAAGRWIALLDSEATARRLAASLAPEVAWARSVLEALEHWQAAFRGRP